MLKKRFLFLAIASNFAHINDTVYFSHEQRRKQSAAATGRLVVPFRRAGYQMAGPRGGLW